MKKSFAIFNSNRINKYGYKLTTSALEGGVWSRGIDGVPMHISYDLHRLIGWSLPFGLYLEPTISLAVGLSLFAENPEESELIRNARNNYLSNCVTKELAPYKEDFIAILGDHYSTNGRFHNPSCAA